MPRKKENTRNIAIPTPVHREVKMYAAFLNKSVNKLMALSFEEFKKKHPLPPEVTKAWREFHEE